MTINPTFSLLFFKIMLVNVKFFFLLCFFRILPSSLEDQCDQYIEAYAEKIIELVIQEFTPDQICKELGLCASAISEEPKEPIVLTLGDQKCIVCEYIMSYLEDALGQNSTEAEIKEALEEV